jgi:hypothetical protein
VHSVTRRRGTSAYRLGPREGKLVSLKTYASTTMLRNTLADKSSPFLQSINPALSLTTILLAASKSFKHVDVTPRERESGLKAKFGFALSVHRRRILPAKYWQHAYQLFAPAPAMAQRRTRDAC